MHKVVVLPAAVAKNSRMSHDVQRTSAITWHLSSASLAAQLVWQSLRYPSAVDDDQFCSSDLTNAAAAIRCCYSCCCCYCCCYCCCWCISTTTANAVAAAAAMPSTAVAAASIVVVTTIKQSSSCRCDCSFNQNCCCCKCTDSTTAAAAAAAAAAAVVLATAAAIAYCCVPKVLPSTSRYSLRSSDATPRALLPMSYSKNCPLLVL
eukprot:4673-Heterococcus_DN1.PRE.2